MSEFLQLLVPNFERIAGLEEQLVLWGGEVMSLAPPRYRYGHRLDFCLVPSFIRVGTRLPEPLQRVSSWLLLDMGVPLDWRYGGLSEFHEVR